MAKSAKTRLNISVFTEERQRTGGRGQEVLENNSSLCQKGLKPRSFIYEKQKICILRRAAQKNTMSLLNPIYLFMGIPSEPTAFVLLPL